jgi:hypothetical protein
MKNIFFTLLLSFFSVYRLFSQPADRMFNKDYMQTVFTENFDGTDLNRNVWNVTNDYKRELGVLTDSPQTLAVKNGNLELTMRYSPDYHSENYSGDFIGAEISTKTLYRYGSFECLAKFAHNGGSWPAFWMIGGDNSPCPPGGFGNEIDIAELKVEPPISSLNQVIHRYYPLEPPYNCSLSNSKEKDIFEYSMDIDNNYHIYKCVWTPAQISYYVDGFNTHNVYNQNQEWYPNLSLSVMLSQQVLQPKKLKDQANYPVVPQTSYFDYIKVKQFFLAPEITCPTSIVSSGIAKLDVDSMASGITWQLTPPALFTISSGTGETANIVRATDANGLGKITYTFNMPGGEIFTAEKKIHVGNDGIKTFKRRK